MSTLKTTSQAVVNYINAMEPKEVSPLRRGQVKEPLFFLLASSLSKLTPAMEDALLHHFCYAYTQEKAAAIAGVARKNLNERAADMQKMNKLFAKATPFYRDREPG